MSDVLKVIEKLERRRSKIDAAIEVLREELGGRAERATSKPRSRSKSMAATVRQLASEFLDAAREPMTTAQVRAALDGRPELEDYDLERLLYNILKRASESGKTRIKQAGRGLWTTVPNQASFS